MEWQGDFEKGLLCGQDCICIQGGRITLIKSTVSSTPLSLISLVDIQKSTCKCLVHLKGLSNMLEIRLMNPT